MDYSLEIDADLSPVPVLPALIWAESIDPLFSDQGMPDFLAQAIEVVRKSGENAWPAGTKKSVRDMLRHGRYKPSGRSKPASEFLLKAALSEERQFPTVCGPVDVNNAVSLESGLPGSIFDVDLSGEQLLIRRGLKEESYVFNPSGQSIGLEDLLLVCRKVNGAWEPCGNPVKDSMATKIRPETRRVIAVLYVPIGEQRSTAERWAARFAELLQSHCKAESTGYELVGSNN